jgi:hypothetical protein
MTKMDLKVVPDEKLLKVDVVQEDRVLYSVNCVNLCHFYAVAFLAQKKIEGQNVDSEIFNLKKE